ncbi:MAG: hypothetical protein V4642_12015 [Bacteroidota bacterium]
MGHIKEPEGVDFVIKSKPLTKEEEALISSYIKAYKEKNYVKKKIEGKGKSRSKIVV